MPAVLDELYPGREWIPAWDYEGTVTTWRSGDLFAKVKHVDATIRLIAEGERMQWARAYVRVPEVVRCETIDGVDVLVTRALQGVDATDDAMRAAPESLVPAVARGLRRWHDALPVDACPFDFRLDTALTQVRRRAHSIRVNELHSEHQHLGVARAIEKLEKDRLAEVDLVVCHGDYCFPNVLLESGEVTGYVDLGEVGVADRWWDLAVAQWSTTWNVGPGWEDLFLEAYGVARDEQRQAYYRLLYDLAS